MNTPLKLFCHRPALGMQHLDVDPIYWPFGLIHPLVLIYLFQLYTL